MSNYRVFHRLHRCLYLCSELINELNAIRRDVDPTSLELFTECLGYSELLIPAVADLTENERRCKK